MTDHICDFVPSKKATKSQLQMTMVMASDQGVGAGGDSSSAFGTVETILEWRCRFCLRPVHAATIPRTGIYTEGYDSTAEPEQPPAPASKDATPSSIATEETHPMGALTPEEQRAYLAKLGG